MHDQNGHAGSFAASPPKKRAGGGTLSRTDLPSQLGNAKGLPRQSKNSVIAAYDSPAYAEALKALGEGAVRDFRIVEGLEKG